MTAPDQPLPRESRRPLDPWLAVALAVLLGLTLGGWLVGRGFTRARTIDRYVTVKGTSEREARADIAFWPLRLVVADNDLAAAHNRLRSQIALVRAFLVRQQLDSTQVDLQGFNVTDAYANQYRTSEVANRYVIRQTLMVRSNDPSKVLAASQRVGELVTAGIVFSSGEEYGTGGPTFVFTGLNQLKPEMIAEATARAREAAEQFARDSRTRLGGIRRATQGVFEILPRDQAPGETEGGQITKTIRIVSTVEFSLK